MSLFNNCWRYDRRWIALAVQSYSVYRAMYPSIFSNLSDSCGLVGHLGTMERLPMGLLSLRVPSNSPTALDSYRPAAYPIVVDYTAHELKWKRMELLTRRPTSRIVALRLSFPGSLQMKLRDSIRSEMRVRLIVLANQTGFPARKKRWIRMEETHFCEIE